MTQEEFERLTSPENIDLLEKHIDDSPDKLAFKLRDPLLVAWIKNLQKCKKKLPNFYNARCFVTSIAFQQCSSEVCAAAKDFDLDHRGGEPQHDLSDDQNTKAAADDNQATTIHNTNSTLAIDLTCGLGVDSLAIAKHYDRVISLEADPIKAVIARYNFEKLGIRNIDVICCRAEEYDFAQYSRTGVDLIYVDPSRETTDGQRVYSIEQSSPNIIELLPTLRPITRRIIIKLSPMFDTKEAFDIFDGAAVEVASLDGECKEVLVKYGYEPHGTLICTVLRGYNSMQRVSFPSHELAHHSDSVSLSISSDDLLAISCQDSNSSSSDSKKVINSTNNTHNNLEPQSEKQSQSHYLLVPDVVFYKSRTTMELMQKYSGRLQSAGAYFYSDSLVGLDNFPGSVLRIDTVLEYNPKALKKVFKSQGIKRANIHTRNFVSSAPEAAKSLGLQLGGNCELYLTTVDNKPLIFFVSLHR